MTPSEIDVWIGKTLFVPPIIKLCHLTRQSQFAISRLFWFIVALDQLRIAQSLASQVIAGLFSIIMLLTASLRADMPTQSMMWFRFIAMGFLILDTFEAVVMGRWRGVEIWLLVLIAEYAATIVTLPPRATGEKRRKTAENRA